MTMPSQAPRGAYTRGLTTSSYRRRRGGLPRPVLLLGGAVILGVIVYLLWPGESPETGGDATAAAETSAAEPSSEPTPATTTGLGPIQRVSPPTPTPRASAPAAVAPVVTEPEAAPPPLPKAARLSSSRARDQFTDGMRLLDERSFIAGRALLSELLFSNEQALAPHDAQIVRDRLSVINETLVFSPEMLPADPLVTSYRVQPGDRLSRIAREVSVPYPLLEQINRVKAVNLQAGKSIKLLNGPLHARIIKHQYILDLYVMDPNGVPIYIRSFPVGLGEFDSTPPGQWIVKSGSKVKNPDWRNPRTGEYYPRDHPDNPIGEYWMALQGTEPATQDITGYGIHGTNEPDSIGSQQSMGCIRLRDRDIAALFGMLMDGQSQVHIAP